jgi:hypothetical protein
MQYRAGLLQGTVFVRPLPDRGTEVCCTVPAKVVRSNRPPDSEWRLLTVSAAAWKRSNRKPKKILIVDDHSVVREGLVQQIKRKVDLEVCSRSQSQAYRFFVTLDHRAMCSHPQNGRIVARTLAEKPPGSHLRPALGDWRLAIGYMCFRSSSPHPFPRPDLNSPLFLPPH